MEHFHADRSIACDHSQADPCVDDACSNDPGRFDIDLNDTPGYTCSFDRKGIGRNRMTYKPSADICVQDDSAAFDPACDYPPWRVHFDALASDPSVFPFWEDYNTFGNSCPIVEKTVSCQAGGRDDYWSGIDYGNDDDALWAQARGNKHRPQPIRLLRAFGESIID